MRKRQRTASRATRVLLGALLIVGGPLAAVGFAQVVATPARAGAEAVPDLAMSPLRDFRIQWVNGRRLLRFTSMMINIGDGHFEVRGGRGNTSQPMAVRQVIFTSPSRAAIAREIPTQAVAQYAGDGHNHWHVQEMMRYDLWGSRGTLRGAKVGFCFLDSDAYNIGLPGASGSPFYRGSWCSTDPNALGNRMGISIGWGDEYTYNLAWQWVDITGLPGGTYTIRSKVDPYGFFTELDENNQCTFARVSWTSTSNTVTVHQQQPACANDWSDHQFNHDIYWAFQSGITVGCAPDLFCTNNLVNREQMATFLMRALGLPAAVADHFFDDESSGHEDAINRIADAGITVGCAAGRYCPRDSVRRDQMASFLARAWSLPPTDVDFFVDDEGNVHEDAINRVAAAGITLGCGGSSYCPKTFVTRGQMAAFLHRAVAS